MTVVYRLVRRERAADVLSGEGASLYGGRWNPPGAPVVYASESRALAVLETFVHVTAEARAMRFLLYAITLPKGRRLKRHGHGGSSRAALASSSTQEAGRAWLEEGKALALVAPSIVVPQECNYVLNVRHAQFAQVRVAEAEPFSFDERLWKA